MNYLHKIDATNKLGHPTQFANDGQYNQYLRIIRMSPFSRFLKALRIRRDLQQNEVARRLGYEQSYVSALERSEKGPPRREFVERLIKGLDLDDKETTELHRTLRESRRQLVLPAKASDEEYAMVRLLEPQLGHLLPVQIQLIELALRIPESSDGHKHALERAWPSTCAPRGEGGRNM